MKIQNYIDLLFVYNIIKHSKQNKIIKDIVKIHINLNVKNVINFIQKNAYSMNIVVITKLIQII